MIDSIWAWVAISAAYAAGCVYLNGRRLYWKERAMRAERCGR